MANGGLPCIVCALNAACYDDCKCLGFHWNNKAARCGLKAQGDIPVRYLAQLPCRSVLLGIFENTTDLEGEVVNLNIVDGKQHPSGPSLAGACYLPAEHPSVCGITDSAPHHNQKEQECGFGKGGCLACLLAYHVS